MTGMSSSGLVIGNHNRTIHIGSVFDSSAAVTTSSIIGLRINSSGSIGVSHDLTGTSNYNRLMLNNPHDGSCWLQMTSTATGTGANTDGLSIGLNSSNIAHIWQRENAELVFATNGTSRMKISADGYVTKTVQPAFNAHRNGQSAIQMASSAGTDVVFATEDFDNSGSYNNSNGRFTAPIDGKYFFGIQFYTGFSVSAVRVMHANWTKNGSTFASADLFGGINSDGGTHYHPTVNAQIMMSLSANDYVTFRLGNMSVNGSGNTYLYGSTGTRFFGHLVA